MKTPTLAKYYLSLCRTEIEIRQFGGVEAIIYLDRVVDIEAAEQKKESLKNIISKYTVKGK